MTLWSEQISSLYKIRSVSDLPEQELSRQTSFAASTFPIRSSCARTAMFSAAFRQGFSARTARKTKR